ncbi:hypothetical protein QYE76_025580 [Lolium multiflorum]|uniref:Integrase catalytic domain-containing protein n=1 Tax=Lolium multiflorum TaxID=4521 RepID=A0AAD8REC7_LOLMU|nr:hypothetical protein QYE76_025580 [Lolium multiflorum]
MRSATRNPTEPTGQPAPRRRQPSRSQHREGRENRRRKQEVGSAPSQVSSPPPSGGGGGGGGGSAGDLAKSPRHGSRDARERLNEYRTDYIGPKCFGRMIREEPKPRSSLKLPGNLKHYDGTERPDTWIEDYYNAVTFAGGTPNIACRMLQLYLVGPARISATSRKLHLLLDTARKHRPRGKGGKGKNKDKDEDSSEAMDEDDNSPDPKAGSAACRGQVPCTFDREDHPVIVPKECYALVHHTSVAFGDVHNFREEKITFEVVPFKSSYHVIFGRPTYHKFHARACYIYNKLKIPGPKAQELKTIPITWPFAVWGLDMVGKLKRSSPGGFEYLLVAVDKFSKWIEAKPVRKADGATALKFVCSLVMRFGIPHSIITDNGTNFAREN